MKFFAFGFVSCLVVLALGATAWLYSGGLPMKMSSGALPLEHKIAKIALHAAIGDFENHEAPFASSPEVMKEGDQMYRKHCATCHGLEGTEKTELAMGLFPPPPNLLPPSKGVTDDPVGETFWKIKYGIRMTAMPAFEKSLSDNEIWKISLFLLNRK